LPLSPPPDTPRRFDDAEIRRVGRWRGAHGLTTVTRKLPLLTLPAASVAVQVTVVIPMRKMLPEGGVQRTLGEGSTLSVALTLKVTIAPSRLVAVTTMLPGSDRMGAVTSPELAATVRLAVRVTVP